MKLLFIRAGELNPYYNQAIEATLLEMANDDTEILYLWQNDKVAFIGKNQNAYTECKVPYIEADGGYIARRISGGGAVYHDKGNINFTFLSSKKNFSIKKNFEIMTCGMKKLGFDAELNGRNDVVIGGRKFSGNAFYRGNTCFHHGTVLISANYEKMSAYLNVPKVKLEAKGVSSVVSRVINLNEIDPTVTADKVAHSLREAYENYYGAKALEITDKDLDQETLKAKCEFFTDANWRKGDNIYYDAQAVVRFGWGTADIRLKINGNIIEKAKIYTDCLDYDEVALKESLLIGADLYKGKQGVDDIIEAFKEQKNEF
ncbi:MAG: lipoate--protein ligase [Clostridiales bacterium]|nr:lipoate--protein ligase [Clostridiales bacterium]